MTSQGKINNKENPLANEIRPGTSGIDGHHYETKLICLLLHRALRDSDIDKFYLGTNINEVGAFDDIVFKYYLKNDKIPKIFFVQAKHKDKLNEQLKISTLLKPNNDFSLDKYYESYEKIKKKLRQNCVNYMFKSDIKQLNYCFLIYTPILEGFGDNKKKLITEKGKEALLLTNTDKGGFLLNIDDTEKDNLCKSIMLQNATLLAKAFAEKLQTDNYKNMMMSELIRVYHVYLAQNVVEIIPKSDNDKGDFLTGKFRTYFLNDKYNKVYIQMKEIIFKKLNMQDCMSMDSSEINKTFKLPITFGNSEIKFNKEEYGDLCKMIKTLVNNKNENNIVTIDDKMIGRYNSIQNKEIDLLGKLVGEKLFFDGNTGLFKFSFYRSNNHKSLLKMLKQENLTENDLELVRFDIHYNFFPRLSLCNEKHEKIKIDEFLSKLIFFTNQAQEENVESILKTEIEKYSITKNEKNSATHINIDAIYLKYHDNIQKWWKDPREYLTKTCKFFEDAKNDFLYCPILNVFHYIYVTKMNNFNIEFDQKAVNHLGLKEFINNSHEKVFCINTKDSVLTSIKTIQYFRDEKNIKIYKFVTLDSVIAQGNSEDILTKIAQTKEVDIFILVLSEAWDEITVTLTTISSYINSIAREFIKKVIIICPSKTLRDTLKKSLNFLEQKDENNTLGNLSEHTKRRLLEQNSILFQEKEISLASLLCINIQDDFYLRTIQGDVLSKIINNKIVKIGTEPTNINTYCRTKKMYISRRVSRCLRLIEKQYNNYFTIYDGKNISTPESHTDKDIIIISNNIEDYKKAYITMQNHRNKNVHFFIKTSTNMLLWKKSYNSIQNLFPYIEVCETIHYLPVEPQSMQDLDEKVVIISAEPGSGKSTFVTHMMMQTKCLEETMCILKLDLLHFFFANKELKTWNKFEGNAMKLKIILSVLYRSFALQNNHNNKITFQCFGSAIIDSDYRIYLSDIHKTKHGIDLFELQTFIDIYNNSKMSLIFDGFDEICPDHKNEAIDLFKVLKNSRVQRLWITSRTNIVLKELECELNTFSYILKRFSGNDQLDFFRKKIKLELEVDKNAKTKNDNDEMYYAMIMISSKIDFKKGFTGTPLHLRMIADILKNEDIQSEIFLAIKRQSLNVTTLYEKFVDFIYYDIRFGEKQKSNECLSYPDLRNIIKNARNTTMENHKLLAAYSILDKKLLTENELDQIDAFIKNINNGDERTGIIESIYNNNTSAQNSQIIPKFVHFTFAEYFASEFLCDKIKERCVTEYFSTYLVNDVLAKGDGGIRWFMDSKMGIERDLTKVTSRFISKVLLMQRPTSKSTLDIALLEERVNIAEFLMFNLVKTLHSNQLDEFIDLITQNRLTCSICCELDKPKNIPNYRPIKLLSMIIETIAKYDASKLVKLYFLADGPNFDLFKHSIVIRDPLIATSMSMKDMLDCMSPADFTKLLTTSGISDFTTKKTILHTLLLNSNGLSIDMLERNLIKLNREMSRIILGYRDKWMRVPAHYAALKQNYKFFELMADLVGNVGLREICTITDSYGLIPLRYFGLGSCNRILNEVIYGGDEIISITIGNTLDTSQFKSLCNKVGITYNLGDKDWHNLHDIKTPYFMW